MSRNRGFTVRRTDLGGSRGVTLNYLGRRKRPDNDDGRSQQHPVGVKRITNAQLPQARLLDNEMRHAELQGKCTHLISGAINQLQPIVALPESTQRAAARIALDNGHVENFDLSGDEWQDVPMDLDAPNQIDLSHEGGEFFHFVEMMQDSFGRLACYFYLLVPIWSTT